jgi:SAM-dependent methyltransferase
VKLRSTVKVLRSGAPRTRLRAYRDGRAAVRIGLIGAGLDIGVLDMLRERPSTTHELTYGLGLEDVDLLEAFVQVLVAAGVVDHHGTRWVLTRAGRSIVADDVARASYEAFSGYHIGLYRELDAQLRGGSARRDIAEKGELIARLSTAFEPFVADALTELIGERVPERVLDVGCGAGHQLVTILGHAPNARGLGIEADPAAAALAEHTLGQNGLADRADILVGDAREILDDAELIGGPVDLVLLANLIYYVPLAERAETLRKIAAVLAPRGVLLVVSSVIARSVFSRHFDLLLRSQGQGMELPVVEELVDQLREVGLMPRKPRRIAPGEPLMAFAATRPE